MGDLLTGERVSVYRLNRELAEAGRTVSRTTLYRLAHNQPERIDLEVAGRVLWGLERITGKHYAVGDLLEYEVPAAPPPPADDDRVWLDYDLSRLGEIDPYEWGEGETLECTPAENAAPPRLTAAGVPYTGDSETDAVLDEHPDILERIRRHEAGETTSRPLRDITAELDL